MRSLLVLAAVTAAVSVTASAAAAYDAPDRGAARTVPLAIPLPGDLLVARLDLRTDTEGARLPRIRLLGKLPEGVRAATGVGLGARAGRGVAFVVLANAAGSDAVGTLGVTLGSGGATWRILASAPRGTVHLLFAADGAAANGVATADPRFCRGPAGGPVLVHFGVTAACNGQAAASETLAALLGAGTAAAPPAPHPAECFGTWFPSGPALHFEFRLGCPTPSEGFGVFAVGAQHTTVPDGCSQTSVAGGDSSTWQCFPNPPLPPGTMIAGAFDLDGEPTKVGAVINPANRTVLLFTLARQDPSGCSGSTERVAPARLRATVTCPLGASLFGFQVGLAGGPAAPRIQLVSTTTRGCSLVPALGSSVFSAVRCSGYYGPKGATGFSATLLLDLVAPGGASVDATFTAQPASGAWELLAT